MRRRELLRHMAVAGSGLATGLDPSAALSQRSGPAPGQGARPNVLLIIADQMRADVLGCAGHPDVRTPNLDWIANTGVRFEQAYCATPVCVPSRVSLITSQYPHTTGCKDNSMHWAGTAPTLPALLEAAGYRRTAVGKRHFGRPHQEPLGFERIVDVREKGLLKDDDYHAYIARLGLLDRAGLDTVRWRRALMGHPSELPEEHYVDAYIGRRAVEEIEHLSKQDAPWFLWVGFPSPHPPTDPPEPWASMYDERALTLPEFDPAEFADKPEVHAQQRRRRRWFQRGGNAGETPESVRRFLKHYYGLVSLVDHWVGQLLASLEATGQLDRTLIIFTSDHGAYAGNHGALFKGFAMFECLTRIPLLMRWPSYYEGGTVATAPVQQLDLLPTLLDVAGVERPWGAQGYSLQPWLAGMGGPPREYAFAEYHYQKLIRRGRYKLIEHVGKPLGELYDLAEDPGERRNRYRDPTLADTREALKALLLQHLVASENPGSPFRSDFSNAGAFLSDPSRGSI